MGAFTRLWETAIGKSIRETTWGRHPRATSRFGGKGQGQVGDMTVEAEEIPKHCPKTSPATAAAEPPTLPPMLDTRYTLLESPISWYTSLKAGHSSIMTRAALCLSLPVAY